MRTTSCSDILETWERGNRLHPLDRSLLALSMALSFPREDLADWPLGRRNRSLFEVYCSMFGSRLQGWTACPECGEKVEIDLDARVLMTTEGNTQEPESTVTVGSERFRLPTSRDMAHVIAASEDDTAATHLLERCRVSGTEPFACTNEVLEQVGEKLASADPMAETRLALCCPECDGQWDETLDIGGFVWAEIEVRAERILWEVHTLASSYGWTEAETLSLSAARRALYLEMAQS